MTTYHIRPESNRPNICHAQTPDACPIKDSDGNPGQHFEDKAEAKLYAETKMTKELGATTTLTKSSEQDKLKQNKRTQRAILQKIEKNESKISELQEQSRLSLDIREKRDFDDQISAVERENERLQNDYETLKKDRRNIGRKTVAVKPAKEGNTGKTSLAQLEKEVADLRARKENASPDEIKKINGIIRGKSIHIARAKKAAQTEAIAKKAKTQETVRNTEPVKATQTQQPTFVSLPELGQTLFSKDSSIDDKKAAISGFLKDPKNYEPLKKAYASLGYNLDESQTIQGFIKNGTGNSTSIRQAVRSAEKDGTRSVSEILMRIEDADREQEINKVRSALDNNKPEGDTEISEDELDRILDEAPEELKNDPDFAIDEDE